MRSQFAGVRKTGAISSSQLCLTVSALALAMAAPGVALAQDAPPPQDEQAVEVEEVVVTGLRAGLADSISIKRNETSIVEAVSAEDIGKLPDVSIAESIARLPGLAAQRVNGRAQVISIRGLAPDFTTTLLNGRQQASSGDNRAVEFDQYPSELLSGVVIYKTPDAEISGMGLSGTADLRTVRPLEFGRRAVAVNLRGERVEGDSLNADVDNFGGRFSISYIDQFADDTLGLALGYAHLDSPSQNRHYKAYGYESFGGVCEPNPPINNCTPESVTPDSADNALILNGQELFATSRLNTRDAVIGILEWRPNGRLHSTLDLYYSKFDQEETMRGAQWFSNAWADNAYFTDVETEDRGGSLFATSGTLHGGIPIIRNDYNTRQDELFSAGLNTEYEIDDRTRVEVDLSYSTNERREQILETYAGYGLGPQGGGRTPDTIDFEVNEDGYPTYTAGLDYADASQVSLGDRAPWGGWGHDGAIRFPDVEERIYAADLKFERDLEGIIHTVSAGVNLANRNKTKRVDDFDLFLKNGRQQVYVDPQYLVEPTSLDFGGFGDVLSVDLTRALDVYYDRAPILDANYFDKNWDIEEEVITWFARAEFEKGQVRGNFGVQIVQQSQESSGVIINGTEPGQPITPISITDGEDYIDVLPSLNMIYDFGDGHRVRFAASKTMARPRMDELRANVTPGFDALVCSAQPCPSGSTVNPWSASGGNPNLEPWRATAFDLAYEWYVNPTTYLSIAGFYKHLDSYIYQQTGTFDFTGIPLPAAGQLMLQNNPGVIISPIGRMTLPANGQGGVVKGVEISGAFNFGTVWEPLDGLGVLGSVSFTESDLNPSADGAPTRIPGLSGMVYNMTAYYERGGFQARISKRFREAFKGEVVQLFATRGQTEIMDDEQIDAQIGYTFESGPMEGFGVQFQVNNLTNSPYRTRLGIDGGGTTTADGSFLPETYEEYGRQFLFGVNYRF